MTLISFNTYDYISRGNIMIHKAICCPLIHVLLREWQDRDMWTMKAKAMKMLCFIVRKSTKQYVIVYYNWPSSYPVYRKYIVTYIRRSYRLYYHSHGKTRARK